MIVLRIAVRLAVMVVVLLLLWCGWIVVQWMIVRGVKRAWHALGNVPEPILRAVVLGGLVLLLVRLLMVLAPPLARLLVGLLGGGP